MQMTGRHQVSVPKAASVTITVGTANNALTIFATGDGVLAGDITANTSTADISLGANVSELAGFANGQTVIVGYGTDNEEQLTVSGHSAVTGAGALSVKGPILKAHKKNERVVVKPTYAIVPGTIVVSDNGVADGVVDSPTAPGTLTGGNINTSLSFVDYSTGSIRLKYNTAPATAGPMTIKFDTISEVADVNDLTGNAFQKNWQAHNLNRQSVPDLLQCSNLGTKKIGCFVEVSKNGGKSFTMKGLTNVSAQLGQYGRARLVVPTGQASILDVVRFRGGILSSEGLGLDETDPQERQQRTGCVEIDTSAFINDNGQ